MALATNIALAVAANLRKTSINTVEKAAELRKTYSDEWVLGKGPTVDIWTIYTADKPIGVPGAYGSARTAIHKQTRVKRVVKTISKRGRDAETIARFRGEIETMRKLDHPNVVKFYEAYESKDDLFIGTSCNSNMLSVVAIRSPALCSFFGCVLVVFVLSLHWPVMEHCGGGDLFEEVCTLSIQREDDVQEAPFAVLQLITLYLVGDCPYRLRSFKRPSRYRYTRSSMPPR